MIAHDVRGTGPTVLLLHSGGMSSRQWRKLGDRLAESYRVVAPDFLGSGANPVWPEGEPFDFHADVAAVSEVLDSVGGPAHVVGHSYGGLIGMTLARQRPADLKSLTVYDPVVFGILFEARDAEGLADLESLAQNPVFSEDSAGGTIPWLEAFIDYWSGVGAWSKLPPAAQASFMKVGRKLYGEVKSLMLDRTPASAYATLTAPALLLTGETSPASVRRITTLLSEALPTSEAHVVAGAGHMGPITHANAVNDVIAAHLSAAQS